MIALHQMNQNFGGKNVKRHESGMRRVQLSTYPKLLGRTPSTTAALHNLVPSSQGVYGGRGNCCMIGVKRRDHQRHLLICTFERGRVRWTNLIEGHSTGPTPRASGPELTGEWPSGPTLAFVRTPLARRVRRTDGFQRMTPFADSW